MAPKPPPIQPPPMAYRPSSDNGWLNEQYGQSAPHAYYTETFQSTVQSPFSPTMSSALSSPGHTKSSPSLDSHRLGKALSETSGSSVSSPVRSSYGGFVPQAMQHSDQLNRDSNSHRPSPASPGSQNSVRDVEKQQVRDSSHTASSRTKSNSHGTSASGPHEVDEILLESKALKILIYLSTLNPFVSLTILLYTLFALLALLLLQPFRLCTKSTTFRHQVIGFLAPTLKIQLAFIYSPDNAEDYSAPLLVLINLLSPIVSLGVAFAAWVAAAFWFFNAILGDPDGSDKPRGYNDGRASVIGVRKWWEHWLIRTVR